MRISVAQTKPVKGDIPANITTHVRIIEIAVAENADTVIFPELSLTGYEPELTKTLATHKDDPRLDVFQEISDTNKITIGVGMPINNNSGVSIGMILFIPHSSRQLYLKKYLHSDENPYFIPGNNKTTFIDGKPGVALSICYELSIPQHAEDAARGGAKIYVSSSAKTAPGVESAVITLSGIARDHSMTVYFSNCIGPCDNFQSAGKSAIWDNRGTLLGQLDDLSEGILLFDTETGELIEKKLSIHPAGLG
jgi:predicted amidohydrolase